MEVLAEPLLEVTPEGFTKEVVKLEDGDLNQWPCARRPQEGSGQEHLPMSPNVDRAH